MIVQRVVETWDELPPAVIYDGQVFSTRLLEKQHRDLVREVAILRDAVAKRDGLLDLQDRRIKVLESLVQSQRRDGVE